MRYKVIDAEIKEMINDWPAEWWESVSIEEALMGPPEDAPEYHVWKYDQHEYDEELLTKTPTNLEYKHILKEIKKKMHMDQESRKSTISAMEVQLNQLVKSINDATNVDAKEMRKSMQEGFIEVRTKLDFVYEIVSKRAPESMTVQETMSINTEPRARNFQIS